MRHLGVEKVVDIVTYKIFTKIKCFCVLCLYRLNEWRGSTIKDQLVPSHHQVINYYLFDSQKRQQMIKYNDKTRKL